MVYSPVGDTDSTRGNRRFHDQLGVWVAVCVAPQSAGLGAGRMGGDASGIPPGRALWILDQQRAACQAGEASASD